MYIFGGKDEDNLKLNDIWKYNFETRVWTEIHCVDAPLERSGHSASIYAENYMIIYGGIFEITKELNDMHIFDLRNEKWICLFEEINSPKKMQEAQSPDKTFKSSPTMKARAADTTTGQGKFGISFEANGRKLKTSTGVRKSPKKKILALRSKEEVQVIKLESPTSISMKNSFLIKNADPSFDKCYNQMKKRNMEKTGIETIMVDQTKTPGKRPAARDGHTGLVIDDSFYVFGGDRHHMPFNDFYMLNVRAEFECKNFMF